MYKDIVFQNFLFVQTFLFSFFKRFQDHRPKRTTARQRFKLHNAIKIVGVENKGRGLLQIELESTYLITSVCKLPE